MSSGAPFYEIYADESSQNCHKFLVIAGLLISKNKREEVISSIQEVRTAHRLIDHELKWGSVSNSKYVGYKAIVDRVFSHMNAGDICIRALSLDTHTCDHSRHSAGDREAGFNKIIFQLPLHKFGRPFGRSRRLEVMLDMRCTKQQPDDLRNMLNSVLARDHSIPNSPFRLVVFCDSKKSPLIQVIDLVAGAIAYRKNRHHQITGANQAKCDLAIYMAQKAGGLIDAARASGRTAAFDLWNFRYNAKRSSHRPRL
jgi:hypothetical protein